MRMLMLLAIAVISGGSLRARDVLVIVADDLRADITSTYGGPVPTPNLDKLAARGCRFTRATCGYPICHVSRSEILSGRCLVAEASAGGAIPFDANWTLWPAAMQRAGWHTVHSGKWHVAGTPWQRGYVETVGLFSSGGGKGLPCTLPASATGREVTGYRGWTFKTNENKPLLELGVGLTPETDARIADAAIGAIRAGRGERLFLHVNFTAPHDPLHWPPGMEGGAKLPEPVLPRNFAPRHPFDHGNINGRDEMIVPAPRSEGDVKRERAVYHALVANLDAQVGRIVAALEVNDALSHTWIVFTSDQGLALGSHGLMGKQNQYEHTVNVPLIIAGPRIPSGRSIDAQCTLRDLYPTICELAGVAIPPSVQGTSLMPVIRGEKRELHGAVFGYFTGTQRMMRASDGWKLIWYPKVGKRQLFHLPDDPDEVRDLASDPAHAPQLQSLTTRLETWRRERSDPLNP